MTTWNLMDSSEIKSSIIISPKGMLFLCDADGRKKNEKNLHFFAKKFCQFRKMLYLCTIKQKRKENIMEMKVYIDVDKVFTCRQILITRQDFESMSGMLMAELCDDDTMQKIADDVCKCMEDIYTKEELEMFHLFRIGDVNKFTRNEIIACVRMSWVEFELMEKFALKYGMCYWEDLTNEEQDYLIDNYNF